MSELSTIRARIRELHRAKEESVLRQLVRDFGPDNGARVEISSKAASLINDIRTAGTPGLMEVFLAEYGLSTDEGVALMCLAEALLRVPDAQTIDELIEDKIAPSSWGEHLGQSSSSLVNASTWALMLTGKVLKEPGEEGLADILHGAVRRLGEAVDPDSRQTGDEGNGPSICPWTGHPGGHKARQCPGRDRFHIFL